MSEGLGFYFDLLLMIRIDVAKIFMKCREGADSLSLTGIFRTRAMNNLLF